MSSEQVASARVFCLFGTVYNSCGKMIYPLMLTCLRLLSLALCVGVVTGAVGGDGGAFAGAGVVVGVGGVGGGGGGGGVGGGGDGVDVGAVCPPARRSSTIIRGTSWPRHSPPPPPLTRRLLAVVAVAATVSINYMVLSLSVHVILHTLTLSFGFTRSK